MKTEILRVEDTFLIRGRGLVVCGRKTEEFLDFKIGDSIEIETSDNTFLQTKIRGLELISRSPYNDKIICFLVGDEINKSDLPKDAIIWLINKGV